MANKKINELTSRTPTLTDLALIGDPTTGFSFQCTLTALQTLIGTSIYTGNGTLLSNRTVTMSTFSLDFNASGNSRLFIATNGRVSVGTSNPLNKFEINNGGTTTYNGNDFMWRNSNGESALHHTATASRWMASKAIVLAPNSSEQHIFTTTGNTGLGTLSPAAKLDVNGDGKFLGITNNAQFSSQYFTGNFVNGEFGMYSYTSFTPTTNRVNLNSFGFKNVVSYDLTSATYTGVSSINATSLSTALEVAGNAGTQITKVFYGLDIQLLGRTGATIPMNIAEFYNLYIKECGPNGTTGHVVNTLMGIRIDSLKTSLNYTITNCWAIYQEGTSDNNYFAGKMLIGTTSVGSSPVRISGLPTSATGLATGDLWNDNGTIKIK